MGLDVASTVTGAGTALAGLVLVYIGMLVNAFQGYEKAAQRTVKARFLVRAWVGFVGFLFAIVAAAVAVSAAWLSNECAADFSVILLGLGFVAATLSTLLTVLEIK